MKVPPQGDEGDAAMACLTPAVRRAIGHEPAAYRLAVFGILHGSDGMLVGALVRCAFSSMLMIHRYIYLVDAFCQPYLVEQKLLN